MIHDIKQRMIQWENKQERLKRVLVISALVVLAVLTSVIWSLVQGESVRWLVAGVIVLGGLGVFFLTLSAYTNTMLVTMYYKASYHLLAAPEELELVTGTIEGVSTLQIPYIGQLYQLNLRVAGELMRFYCPGKLLRGLQPHERVRVSSYDLFAIRVESTGFVEGADDSKSA